MDNVTNDVSLGSNCSFLAYLCDCMSFKITFYIYECVCTGHGKHVLDRDQFVGIGSLPLSLPCGFQELNPGHPSWWQAPFSHQARSPALCMHYIFEACPVRLIKAMKL